MNILITGAQGQDGIILSEILIKKGFNVMGVIRSKKFKKKINKVKYYILDLFNSIEIERFLSKSKPDYIVHLGSENPSFNQKNKKKKFENKNIKSSLNLINSINNLNLNCIFIFANSSQIFKKTKKRVNEKFQITKKDPYTSFRIDIIKYMKLLKKKNKFKYINLILFNHDSKFRSEKFLLPRIVKSIKSKDKKFINEIYKQNIYADFSHAEDICNAIFLLIKKKIIVDNIILSSSKLTSVNKLIKYLLNKNKIKNIIDSNINIKKKQINLIGDNRFAKEILGWKIKKDIYKALNEMNKQF